MYLPFVSKGLTTYPGLPGTALAVGNVGSVGEEVEELGFTLSAGKLLVDRVVACHQLLLPRSRVEQRPECLQLLRPGHLSEITSGSPLVLVEEVRSNRFGHRSVRASRLE